MLPLADRSWLWIAAAFYLAGFIMGTIAVLRERRHSRGLMYLIIAGGFVMQTVGLYVRGRTVGGCPLGNTFELFQFTAWSATALYLVVGATFRLSLLGYFTSMLATVLTCVSLAIPAWDATRRSDIFGGNPWIEFHAALALFSYGVFGLLALTSVMFLLRHYSLKHKRLSGFFSFLPPIVDLDHINLRLMVTGVLLLAAALAVGSVYWVQEKDRVDPAKIIMTVAVWLAYAIALSSRWRGWLVSRRLAWTCVGLFVAALVSLYFVDASRHMEARTPIASWHP
jgi:HemX protein